MNRKKLIMISITLLLSLSACSNKDDKYKTAKEDLENKESIEVTNIDEDNPDDSVVIIGDKNSSKDLENLNPNDEKFNNKVSEEDKEKSREEAEEKKKAEEAKKAEEKRKAEESKKTEEKRKAEEAKKAEEKRKAEEAKKAEEKRKAEEAKKAEEEKSKDVVNSGNISSGKYKLNSEKYGYGTAWDAKNNLGSKTIVKPGDYYIFSKSEGMINLTTVEGIPGYWVNTGHNSGNNSNSNNSTGETYQLNTKQAGYGTAWDAENNTNSVTNISPGKYYVFSRVNGMINLTVDPSVPGTWINPKN